MNLNQADFARKVGLSAGMISKIEHGRVGVSLELLVTIASRCSVPLTIFLAGLEEVDDCHYTPSGRGLRVSREGADCLKYELIGHWFSIEGQSELHLISCDQNAKPNFSRQRGSACLYMLTGVIRYRHGERTYRLAAGDTLSFNCATLNGLDALLSDTARFLFWRHKNQHYHGQTTTGRLSKEHFRCLT
ncbi:MAG: helix-turn-helix domain-containing protein [Proteobacteria bacterium]|nr:helix-turn-helix domain-containing protein [Pseudomonadota bacterium]